MGTPRAVRIPRASNDSTRVVRPSRKPPSPLPSVSPALVRPNRGGTQRAVRLTILYCTVLAAVYAGFVLYDRTTPGASSPGSEGGLLEFTGVALLLGVVGALLALAAAPRAVEWSSRSFAVVGRWGRRTVWTPVDEVTVRPVRKYPAGLLSDAPVETVEVSGPGQRPRNYLIESGLLPERRAGGAPR